MAPLSPHSSRPADVFRLEEWLREAGITPSKISATAKALRENDFEDQALLARITAEDLKECGITSVGIRKCILECARGDTVPEDIKHSVCECAAPRRSSAIPHSRAMRDVEACSVPACAGARLAPARLLPPPSCDV